MEEWFNGYIIQMRDCWIEYYILKDKSQGKSMATKDPLLPISYESPMW